MSQLGADLMKAVFIEQPLASTGLLKIAGIFVLPYTNMWER